MNEILEEINEILEAVNDSKIPEIMAMLYRRMYFALKNEGFTKEEAMAILTSQGLSIKTS